MRATRWPVAAWVACGVLFVVLATANAAGYRYGVSDQAFHVPAVILALNPAAFPRDAALIESQGRLEVVHEGVAAIVSTTGTSVETVFLASYVLSMAVIWLAIVLIGARLFRSPWAIVALGAVVTMRHRIPRTSVNSFEPYFSPRTLAFAIGLLAVAAILYRRRWGAVLLVPVAALVHVTTGVWFGIVVAVAVAVLDARLRRLLLVAALMAAALGGWALTDGPLASSMTTMDGVWLAAVQSKDSLFPADWPLWTWAANLALPLLLWCVHRVRSARGDATPEDGALVWGGLALLALFLVTLPAVAARWALPTQLQISRVFWLLDFLLALYVIAAVAEQTRGTGFRDAARILGCTLLALSLGRATYVMLVEFPERSLFAVHLPATPWQDAMDWVKRQPLGVHVWTDPDHAAKYGSSVRVAAGRDVFLERVKDSAVAIYSRAVAQRVVERSAVRIPLPGAATDQGTGSTGAARAWAERHGIDLIVTEARLSLPLAYANSQFRIYTPRGKAPEATAPAGR